MSKGNLNNAYVFVGNFNDKKVWINNNSGVISLSNNEQSIWEEWCFPALPNRICGRTHPLKINGLKINVAELCNMKCTYCFANEGTYDNAQGGIMSYENLCNLIQKIFTIYPEGTAGICFFGGEPLLAFPEIKKFIPYVIDLYNKKGVSLPVFSFNTNGTLLNKEIIEFINQYHISVTISIDGDKENHDKMRIFKDGTGTYDTIKQNLEAIEHKQFVLFCEATITEDYMIRYKKGAIREYINSIYDLGFDNYAIFTVDYSDTKEMNLTIYKSKIEEIYTELVEYTFEQLLSEDDWMKASTQIVATIEEIVKRKVRLSCGAGKSTLFSNVNLEIYPCQMYYQAKINKLCTVSDSKIGEKIDAFTPPCRFVIEKCKRCIAYRMCSMWCGGAALLFGKNEQSVIVSRCVAQKKIVEQIILQLVKIRKNEEKYKFLVKNLKKFANLYSSNALLTNKIYKKCEEYSNEL